MRGRRAVHLLRVLLRRYVTHWTTDWTTDCKPAPPRPPDPSAQLSEVPTSRWPVRARRETITVEYSLHILCIFFAYSSPNVPIGRLRSRDAVGGWSARCFYRTWFRSSGVCVGCVEQGTGTRCRPPHPSSAW
eukprot:2412056-Pyramimonas_sp.AAC.2